MKLIKLKITPKSTFASFAKGDMIFGNFAYHLFLNKDNRLSDYLSSEPKIIFSDFLPDNYLYKPTLPLKSFDIDDSEKKEFRKKQWISIVNLQDAKLHECKSINFIKTKTVIRNHINKLTFTTDNSGVFSPYGLEELEFIEQPVLYIMFDEKVFNTKEIIDILNDIGKSGFGKKSSIGKGQFEVALDIDFKGFKKLDTSYYLTLSPTILNNQNIKNAYYNIFNRFGKYHSSITPFKKPVVMADSGAVIELDIKKEYVGKSINNGVEDTISYLQGYSILIPFKFDGKGLKNG
jgi:CRISPR-associated protein Csm4